ncbi:MAG: hypothetical protein AB1432_10390 [Bacteroidota bacterium]
MELIPILSLIILVATISTFILAVGAYILYKVRERKGVLAQAPQPAAIPAELIAPAPLAAEQRAITPERRTFEVVAPHQESYEYQRQPTYGGKEELARGPELRPTYVGNAPSYSEGSRYQRTTGENVRKSDSEKSASKKKFMRYTKEGYVEPSSKEKKQEDNLRWR